MKKDDHNKNKKNRSTNSLKCIGLSLHEKQGETPQYITIVGDPY